MTVLHDSDIDNDNDHRKLMVLQLHGNSIRMVHQMDTIWGQCAWNGIQLITPNVHSDGKIIIKYEVWIILRIPRLSLHMVRGVFTVFRSKVGNPATFFHVVP